MQNESLCNELLQAASRLYHKLTDILDDVYGQGVSTESAATAIHTSCKPADTDQSELSKEFVSVIAATVWTIYMSAASAGLALTQAAWQSVWEWQATPGNGT